MSDETIDGPLCAKCGNVPAGPGGILCTGCVAAIEAQSSLGES